MSLESEFELLVNSYRPIELTTGYLLAQYTLRLHSIYYEVSYQLTIHFDCYEDKYMKCISHDGDVLLHLI